MDFDINNFTKSLSQKLKDFDKQAVTSLCDDLVSHLYKTSDDFPVKKAEEVLSELKNKRMFGLIQKIGSVLILTGCQSPKIRKIYAQSLIDQGFYTASLAFLDNLIRDTKDGEQENKEARGLEGRVYKQLYVNHENSSNPKIINFLKKSLNSYYDVYKKYPDDLWHGINTVALLKRAERDKADVSELGIPDSKEIAQAILSKIEEKDSNKNANTWDFVTAVEACIALNKSDDALVWMGKYVTSPNTDAFELGSTLRQFEEVWQLNSDPEIGVQILPILRAELLKRDGGAVTLDLKELQQQKENEGDNNLKYEKVFGKESYKTYKWYMTGADRCLAIARIGLDTSIGDGTGFLLDGSVFHEKLAGELVLLTNAHVISDDPNERNVIRSQDAIVIFEVLNEMQKKKEEFRISEIIWNSPKEKLDATLVKFKPNDLKRLKEYTKSLNLFPIADRLPVVGDDQRIYIIGHPAGGTLQLSFVDNLLLDHKDPIIHYRTPTFGGSSGSPVFNEKWDLIGLHHAGSNTMKKLNGKGTYEANEGIWIKRVIEGVKKSLG